MLNENVFIAWTGGATIVRKKRERNSTSQAGIREVAAAAGVSIATVSRVLNGTAYVLPETRQRVEASVAELRFVPQSAARALAGRRKMTLGLLVPEISGDFFAPMLRGIERASSAAGYELLIQTTAYRSSTGFRRALGERNTDGLLLFDHSVDDSTLAELEASGFPVVLLYTEASAPSKLVSVTIENERGAADAVKHLAEIHGRRRIVCLVGPEGNHDAASRERGYRGALEKLGIGFDPELLAPGDYSAGRAAESVRALVDRGVIFDAVFAGDDGAAIGVLAALREVGRRVPEDVAVVGFDDQSLAAEGAMNLSTVRAPTEDVGSEAVRLLLRQIEGEERVSSLVLPTVFVPRTSCGCARRDVSN